MQLAVALACREQRRCRPSAYRSLPGELGERLAPCNYLSSVRHTTQSVRPRGRLRARDGAVGRHQRVSTTFTMGEYRAQAALMRLPKTWRRIRLGAVERRRTVSTRSSRVKRMPASRSVACRVAAPAVGTTANTMAAAQAAPIATTSLMLFATATETAAGCCPGTDPPPPGPDQYGAAREASGARRRRPALAGGRLPDGTKRLPAAIVGGQLSPPQHVVRRGRRHHVQARAPPRRTRRRQMVFNERAPRRPLGQHGRGRPRRLPDGNHAR